MSDWYGGSFIEHTVPGPLNQLKGQFVKIEANRQVMIGASSDREVYVLITDLRTAPGQTP